MADHTHTLYDDGKLHEGNGERKYGVTNPVFENVHDTWGSEEMTARNGDLTTPTVRSSYVNKVDLVDVMFCILINKTNRFSAKL